MTQSPITRDQIFPILLRACPALQPAIDQSMEDWRDDGEVFHYLVIADAVRAVIELFRMGETETFPALFRAVEDMLVQGDKYVRDCMVVGFLEDLQNAGLHETESGERKTEPEDFRQFLLPGSELHWDELYAFWEGRRQRSREEFERRWGEILKEQRRDEGEDSEE